MVADVALWREGRIDSHERCVAFGRLSLVLVVLCVLTCCVAFLSNETWELLIWPPSFQVFVSTVKWRALLQAVSRRLWLPNSSLPAQDQSQLSVSNPAGCHF